MRRRMLLKKKVIPYLNVVPLEPQWITSEIPINYNIESNTDWNIT